MAVGMRNSAGVDFDSLFVAYASGTKPANTGFRDSSGVDLANRYNPRGATTKGPDVGYRTEAGVDLSNLFQAVGAANQIALTDRYIDEIEIGEAQAGLRLESTGRAYAATSDTDTAIPGEWMVTPSTPNAALYEAFCTVTAGTISAGSPTDTWLSLGTTRFWDISRVTPGSKVTNIRVQIRRIGTSTILADALFTLQATAS